MYLQSKVGEQNSVEIKVRSDINFVDTAALKMSFKYRP